MSKQSELDEIIAQASAGIGGFGKLDNGKFYEGISEIEAKQAILRWVADEVIGENETGVITDPNSVDYGKPYSNVYVDRDEQRKILAQHGYKGVSQ